MAYYGKEFSLIGWTNTSNNYNIKMGILFEKFTLNPIQVNSYLLWDEFSKEAVIVDPGNFDNRENKLIDDFISSNKLNLKAVWNTHGHIDHIYGNRYLSEKYNAPLYASELEIPNMRSADVYGPSMYGLPAPNSIEPDFLLSESDQLWIGNNQIKVLFVPGHSAGHFAFWSVEQNIIFSGDVLFLNSIGRTDLPGGSFDILEKTIKEVMYNLPDNTIVYSGHGDSTTILNEKKNNPFVRG
jgi:glyoxylase-like metal-dependent hydrolase (beta-lactamase superfamily II)